MSIGDEEDSDPNCVCGHPKDWHGALSACCYGGALHTPNDARVDCKCEKFRPCLDWPDSEDFWWVDYSGDGTSAYIIQSTWFGSEIRLLIGIGGSTTAKEYRERHGPARFTKLIEQNPFEAQP